MTPSRRKCLPVESHRNIRSSGQAVWCTQGRKHSRMQPPTAPGCALRRIEGQPISWRRMAQRESETWRNSSGTRIPLHVAHSLAQLRVDEIVVGQESDLRGLPARTIRQIDGPLESRKLVQRFVVEGASQVGATQLSRTFARSRDRKYGHGPHPPARPFASKSSTSSGSLSLELRAWASTARWCAHEREATALRHAKS